MKKYSNVLLVLIVVILIGTLFLYQYCSKREDNVKKVGLILPLTGDLAFVGEFMKNSILLDSTDVTYIIEDCGGETKSATMAASKLINRDKVSIIVSTLSFLSEAINPICEKANVPHFILSFSPTLIEKDNVIQPFISTRIEAETFVDYIKKGNFKKVAFLRHQEPDATFGFEKIIRPQLEIMGVEIIDVGFNNTTIKDFKPEILKIKQAEPDLLVIQSLAYNIPNIVSAIKAYNISTPILGDVNFLDIQDSQTMELVEGIPFVGIQSLLSPNYKKYKDNYVLKYKKAPFALGSFAYDLGRYMNKMPSSVTSNLGIDNILSILNTTTDSSLVNVNTKQFSETGQENVTCVILTFHNKEIEEYK